MIRGWLRAWLGINDHEDLTEKHARRIEALRMTVRELERTIAKVVERCEAITERTKNFEKELARFGSASIADEQTRDRLDMSAAEARGQTLQQYRVDKAERNANRMRAIQERQGDNSF